MSDPILPTVLRRRVRLARRWRVLVLLLVAIPAQPKLQSVPAPVLPLACSALHSATHHTPPPRQHTTHQATTPHTLPATPPPPLSRLFSVPAPPSSLCPSRRRASARSPTPRPARAGRPASAPPRRPAGTPRRRADTAHTGWRGTHRGWRVCRRTPGPEVSRESGVNRKKTYGFVGEIGAEEIDDKRLVRLTGMAERRARCGWEPGRRGVGWGQRVLVYGVCIRPLKCGGGTDIAIRCTQRSPMRSPLRRSHSPRFE